MSQLIPIIEKIVRSGYPGICPSCGMSACEANYRYSSGDKSSQIYRCSSCAFEFLRPLPLSQIDERQMDSIHHSVSGKLCPQVSRIGAVVKDKPTDMLMFAPLIGLGYISGHSDNLTMIARSSKETNQQ